MYEVCDKTEVMEIGVHHHAEQLEQYGQLAVIVLSLHSWCVEVTDNDDIIDAQGSKRRHDVTELIE